MQAAGACTDRRQRVRVCECVCVCTCACVCCSDRCRIVDRYEGGGHRDRRRHRCRGRHHPRAALAAIAMVSVGRGTCTAPRSVAPFHHHHHHHHHQLGQPMLPPCSSSSSTAIGATIGAAPHTRTRAYNVVAIVHRRAGPGDGRGAPLRPLGRVASGAAHGPAGAPAPVHRRSRRTAPDRASPLPLRARSQLEAYLRYLAQHDAARFNVISGPAPVLLPAVAPAPPAALRPEPRQTFSALSWLRLARSERRIHRGRAVDDLRRRRYRSPCK